MNVAIATLMTIGQKTAQRVSGKVLRIMAIKITAKRFDITIIARVVVFSVHALCLSPLRVNCPW